MIARGEHLINQDGTMKAANGAFLLLARWALFPFDLAALEGAAFFARA